MEKQILEWGLPEYGGISSSNMMILTASDPDKPTPHWPTDCKSISLTIGIQNPWAGKEVPLESQRRFKGLDAGAIVFAGMNENLLEIP